MHQYVKSRPEFSTFKKAIDETAKYRTLFKQQMQNPLASITILLPTNNAFKNLSKATGRSVNYLLTNDRKVLTEVLEYHVIPAPSTEVESQPLTGLFLSTVLGARLTTREGFNENVCLISTLGNADFDTPCCNTAFIDGAFETRRDAVNVLKDDQACASTIYVIDQVLLPCDAEDLVENACEFQ